MKNIPPVLRIGISVYIYIKDRHVYKGSQMLSCHL